jgi:SAM-dependent methyltransferase
LPEFDYQWKNLPANALEYSESRIAEFLGFTKIKPSKIISGRHCLDAGCGSGRYTYAMLKLGAMRVDSFDISPEAVVKCKDINPNAFVFNIMDLEPLPRPIYDFVLCWGVLHHLQEPRKAFSKLVSQVTKDNGRLTGPSSKQGGMLHIMVYHKKTQKLYERDRAIWPSLSLEEKLELCKQKVQREGGTVHGWFDALNPEFNWGFEEKEIKKWFDEEGLSEIKIITTFNINIQGHF